MCVLLAQKIIWLWNCSFPELQAGKVEFEDLEKHALEWGEPPLFSGKQVRITLL
jgi:hypothetical protein